MRVLVTGGGGFLGSHLVERLEADGHDVVVARSADYDLTAMADTAQMFDDADAELVFHLAAEVGGIGANRANPGRYWFANLAMGANVLEQARAPLHAEARHRRHGLRLPEVRTCAVQRGRPLGRLSGGDERAVRRREEGGARRRAGVPRAVRARRHLPPPHEPLRPARQLRPRDVARDPGADPEDGRGRRTRSSLWGDGSPTREFLYVDDCVEGLILAAERYDGADPVNLGAAREISIRDLAELIADVTGYEGGDRLGHLEAERPAAAERRRRAGPRAVRVRGEDVAARGDRAHRRVVPLGGCGCRYVA